MSRSRFLLRLIALPSILFIGCGEAPSEKNPLPESSAQPAAEETQRLPEPMSVEMPAPSEPPWQEAVDCTTAPTTRKDLVCWRWRCDRTNRSEGTWSGNLAACNAGDISAAGRANALKQVNLYRFIADLPAVANDATKSSNAQKCALMQHANGMLSHAPPTSWKCYTAEGATAAGRSNIATAPAVSSIDLYMADPGNPTTIGHRRWLLSNSLGPIGIGSTLVGTAGYSCLHVIGGSGAAGKAWRAWPPPGPVPIEMFNALSFAPLDTVGWTLQSDTLNLAGATATVKDGTTIVPFTTTQLLANYGSRYAIRFTATNTAWRAQAGHTYNVTIVGSGIAAITYSVQPTACP